MSKEFDRLAKFQPDRIHCVEQIECVFYLSWTGPQRFDEFQRKNIRCERLGDDHRCGRCSIGEDCGQHDWVCTSIYVCGEGGRRKGVKVIVKEKG